MKKLLVIAALIIGVNLAFAEVNVVTTTTVIYDLVNKIGKDKVKAVYLCRGDQDPHFLEILPSYMLKLRKADLVFKVGLDLEKWLPQLIDGSRNNDLKVIDLSADVPKKEVPTGKTDASQGDVHPYGNPHYWLDPNNAKIMAKEIYDALSDFDGSNEAFYKKNLDSYLSQLDSKINEWNKIMAPLKGKQIICFHASWLYFTENFHLRIAGYVEPKPGVPPTPSHNAEVINLMKKNNIKVILMENYYSESAPNQISKLTNANVVKVPNSVYGMEGIDSYIQLMDYIIKQVAAKS